ncbi:MAG TPA: cytochrome P450 [Pseudomonadales bacterium]|nr:cytochrome P450 [Pseudomonadales bacterium]
MTDVLRIFDDAQIRDPYPRYAQWRERHPIWFDAQSGHWVLSRHDDVMNVLKDHQRFSSSAMGGLGTQLPPITDDPPRHTQLRSIVNKAFTTAMLKSMEGDVCAIANDLVGALPRDRDVDIVQALTTPLPVTVIARMMGIPEERKEDFKRWSDALTGTLAGATQQARQSEIMEMAAFFRGLIPERRARPAGDLVSAVVNAEVDGKGLSEWEIVGFCVLLLIAGNETTTNLLGNLLNVLADRPELWQRLRADPALIEPAIEELLRYDSPVQFLMRAATTEVTLHSKTIAAGDRVIVVMGSANRDASQFDAPDEFRLDRTRGRHLAFGYGVHFCIGAPLARLEARVAMTALLGRAATIERGAGAAQRVPSHLLRGFEHLSLRLHHSPAARVVAASNEGRP